MTALFLRLLRTSLIIGGLTVLLVLLSPLWDRRYSAVWKKRLWCVLAGLSLLGAFLQLPDGASKLELAIPAQQVILERGASGKAPQIQVVDPEKLPAWNAIQPLLGIDASNYAPQPVPAVSLSAIAAVVWLAGTALFLLRLAVGEQLFARKIRRWSKPARSETLLRTYRAVCREAGTVRGPELKICAGIASPMLIGLFHPSLLLPAEGYTETEAVLILSHELTHWRKRDLWWKLLFLMANAVHWFNPAVWLLRWAANQDLERACDERVMQTADMARRQAYSQVLLSTIRKGRQSAVSTYFYGGAGAMRERLRSILDGQKRRGAAPAVACAILAACLVPLISCTQAFGSASGVPDGYTLAATVSLTDVQAQQPETVALQETTAADIVQVLAEAAADDGTRILFYRSQDGGIYGGYIRPGSGSLTRFTEENTVYQTGYAVALYRDVFGRSGFRIGHRVGAADYQMDYYYFDDAGHPQMLAACCNQVLEQDLNGDGGKELLWSYHGSEAFYDFEKDGTVWCADVNGLIADALPDWTALSAAVGEFDGGFLPITYQAGKEAGAVRKTAAARFTNSGIEVYTVDPAAASQPSDFVLSYRGDPYSLDSDVTALDSAVWETDNQGGRLSYLATTDGEVTTARGIHVGSTKAEVLKAYGITGAETAGVVWYDLGSGKPLSDRLTIVFDAAGKKEVPDTAKVTEIALERRSITWAENTNES